MLAIVALPASVKPGYGVPLGGKRIVSVVGADRRCAHRHVLPDAPIGIVRVRAYYLALPSFNSVVEEGVLVDRVMSPAAAFRVKVVSPNPTVRVLGTALVVFGPSQGPHPLSAPAPQPIIPDGTWVVVRGYLFCSGLDQTGAVFINGRKKPFVGEQSWRRAT